MNKVKGLISRTISLISQFQNIFKEKIFLVQFQNIQDFQDKWPPCSSGSKLQYSKAYRRKLLGAGFPLKDCINRYILHWRKKQKFKNKTRSSLKLYIQMGNQKFCWGYFFTTWWELEKEWFWQFKPFSKLKTPFCEYWTSIKIKISMTCVSKEYEIKTKMVQE